MGPGEGQWECVDGYACPKLTLTLTGADAVASGDVLHIGKCEAGGSCTPATKTHGTLDVTLPPPQTCTKMMGCTPPADLIAHVEF
jgi:hypothetical protein